MRKRTLLARRYRRRPSDETEHKLRSEDALVVSSRWEFEFENGHLSPLNFLSLPNLLNPHSNIQTFQHSRSPHDYEESRARRHCRPRRVAVYAHIHPAAAPARASPPSHGATADNMNSRAARNDKNQL